MAAVHCLSLSLSLSWSVSDCSRARIYTAMSVTAASCRTLLLLLFTSCPVTLPLSLSLLYTILRCIRTPVSFLSLLTSCLYVYIYTCQLLCALVFIFLIASERGLKVRCKYNLRGYYIVTSYKRTLTSFTTTCRRDYYFVIFFLFRFRKIKKKKTKTISNFFLRDFFFFATLNTQLDIKEHTKHTWKPKANLQLTFNVISL